MCDCKNELNLDKLCVKCVQAQCIKSENITANNVCAQSVEVSDLFAENETANNICVPGMVQSGQVWSDKSYSNSICAQTANFGTACINNLTVGNLNHCVKWRAAVTNSADIVYNLGSPINWNSVLDDPNSNVSLSPFTYTVPASGYYLLTLHIDINSLAGGSIIAGSPISITEILVNGNELRSQFSPFLSFNDQQSTSLTSLCLLNAGDVLTTIFNILIFDQSSGLIPYIGTVALKSNGQFAGQSGFGIHYLSSLNCTQQICPQCPQVTIPCMPVTTPCAPIVPPAGQEPCDSCQ